MLVQSVYKYFLKKYLPIKMSLYDIRDHPVVTAYLLDPDNIQLTRHAYIYRDMYIFGTEYDESYEYLNEHINDLKRDFSLSNRVIKDLQSARNMANFIAFYDLLNIEQLKLLNWGFLPMLNI